MARRPGPGVDAQGQQVVDPTENVIALNEAAQKRQDDLREMDSKHTRELLHIQERHTREMRRAETDRIDAIRQVDQARVTADAAAAEIRATALQNQVALSADAVRNAAVASAQVGQENLTRVIAPLQTAIEDLRRTQYQQQGERRSAVESTVDHRATFTQIVSAALVFVAVIGLFITFYANSKHSPSTVTELPSCKEVSAGVTCLTVK